MRKPEAPALLVEKTIEVLGGIDIVVNNAGATKRGDFLTLSEDDWTDGFALKFFGAVRLLRAAWPLLKQRKGSVVNIAGVGGRTPGAQFTIGGSVNAAMLSFTKAMADVGVGDGVQVNAINPGAVRTGEVGDETADFIERERDQWWQRRRRRWWRIPALRRSVSRRMWQIWWRIWCRRRTDICMGR